MCMWVNRKKELVFDSASRNWCQKWIPVHVGKGKKESVFDPAKKTDFEYASLNTWVNEKRSQNWSCYQKATSKKHFWPSVSVLVKAKWSWFFDSATKNSLKNFDDIFPGKSTIHSAIFKCNEGAEIFQVVFQRSLGKAIISPTLKYLKR